MAKFNVGDKVYIGLCFCRDGNRECPLSVKYAGKKATVINDGSPIGLVRVTLIVDEVEFFYPATKLRLDKPNVSTEDKLDEIIGLLKAIKAGSETKTTVTGSIIVNGAITDPKSMKITADGILYELKTAKPVVEPSPVRLVRTNHTLVKSMDAKFYLDNDGVPVTDRTYTFRDDFVWDKYQGRFVAVKGFRDLAWSEKVWELMYS